MKDWVSNAVGFIITDFQEWGIQSFGDWLKHYDNENYDAEIFAPVKSYYDKIEQNRFDEITQIEQIVMVNAIALWMIEIDVNEVPIGDLRNKILLVFIETITTYKLKRMGLLQINGEILISNISQNNFIEKEVEHVPVSIKEEKNYR